MAKEVNPASQRSNAKVRKIAIFVSHPIQYFSPLYARLALEESLDIVVFYDREAGAATGFDPGFGRVVRWDIPLLEGYKYRFLNNWGAKWKLPSFLSDFSPSAARIVMRGDFDAVWLHGYGSATNLLVNFCCRLRGIPLFLRCDTHLGLRRSPFRRALRTFTLRRLYKGFSAMLAIGSANRAFYEFHGVPSERIFCVPYAVDHQLFSPETASAAARKQVRGVLGIHDDAKVILFAGKLISLKRPFDLLEAFSSLGPLLPECHLVIVGSGELETKMRQWVQSSHLKNISFAGFANQSEMPRYFAAADVFVFTSENEAWGLVLNEAMATGLPVLVSRGVGAVNDLVKDGINGYQFEVGDVVSLTARLAELMESREKRVRFGRESARIVADWGLDSCVRGVLAALDYATSERNVLRRVSR